MGPRKSDGSGSCYLFKLDDEWIVDATCKGSPARFMNHCCEPNCYSEVMTIDGEKRILILALRDLRRGEEISYKCVCAPRAAFRRARSFPCSVYRLPAPFSSRSYRFSPTDNPDEKIPCYCGSRNCPGSMN